MTTIASILDTEQGWDARDTAIYELLGITSPGAYALREPDGRLMVWASEEDSIDDDGSLATYRSREPITDREWLVVIHRCWIDEYEG